MKLEDAHGIALGLFREHGIASDWSFGFDRAVRRFGCCWHGKQRITLSRALVELNDEDEVVDTILHEIAHALVGPGAGHGPIWQEVAAGIGARPEACYDAAAIRTPERRWAAVCSDHGIVGRRDRLHQRHGWRCAKCQAEVTWVRSSSLVEA